MFRNPLEMLHSFHAQLLYVAEESESDFETAWRLQEERSRGIGLPPRSRGAFLVQYRELGRSAPRRSGCSPSSRASRSG